MKRKNTTTAIFELTNTFLNAMDKGQIPVGLFLDLTKAFDCVNHEKLLRKLEIYGIRGNQLELMKSYLQNRKQKVRIMIDSEIYVSDEEGIINGG